MAVVLSASPGWADTQVLSPATEEDLSLRQLRHRIEVVEEKLSRLPSRSVMVSGGTLGYRSKSTSKRRPLDGRWIKVDLGEVQPLDSIVLAPALLIDAEGRETAFGFPEQFRLEIASTEDFKEDFFIRRFSSETLAGSLLVPLVVECNLRNARWIRVFVEELAASPLPDGGFVFALGEIFAFHQGRNVALGTRVYASDTATYERHWFPKYVVDGYMAFNQSRSGPMRINAYKSRMFEDYDTVATITLDLGGQFSIDEIRLYPAHNLAYFTTFYTHGFGFPARFKIEISSEPSFEQSTLTVEHWEVDYPNPGNKTVMFSVPQVEGRYVKFIGTGFGQTSTGPTRAFALAELEVLSQGKAVSYGSTVHASIPTDVELHTTDELVDGISPQGPIMPLEELLTGLAKRGPLEAALVRLEAALQTRSQLQERRLRWFSWALVGMGLAVLAAFAVLNRLQRRNIRRLRERIAADLHDEIGSNLGSIALLSDQLAQSENLHNPNRTSLMKISKVARESAQTMRDIVWLLGPFADPEELSVRLRETAHLMLHGIEHSFTADAQPALRKLSIEQCRQLTLFYKEALHNITRHARASFVEIQLKADRGALVLHIQDDGIGLESSERKGKSEFLHKLRSRADKLHARLDIRSGQGEGTSLILHFRRRVS